MALLRRTIKAHLDKVATAGNFQVAVQSNVMGTVTLTCKKADKDVSQLQAWITEALASFPLQLQLAGMIFLATVQPAGFTVVKFTCTALRSSDNGKQFTHMLGVVRESLVASTLAEQAAASQPVPDSQPVATEGQPEAAASQPARPARGRRH